MIHIKCECVRIGCPVCAAEGVQRPELAPLLPVLSIAWGVAAVGVFAAGLAVGLLLMAVYP